MVKPQRLLNPVAKTDWRLIDDSAEHFASSIRDELFSFQGADAERLLIVVRLIDKLRNMVDAFANVKAKAKRLA